MMTIKEAEEVEYILKSIRTFNNMNDRIQALFKKGEHKEIATIALEMSSELARLYQQQLTKFPSKT